LVHTIALFAGSSTSLSSVNNYSNGGITQLVIGIHVHPIKIFVTDAKGFPLRNQTHQIECLMSVMKMNDNHITSNHNHNRVIVIVGLKHNVMASFQRSVSNPEFPDLGPTWPVECWYTGAPIPLRQHTKGSKTLYMSKMDI
jgi:hypothetical protein